MNATIAKQDKIEVLYAIERYNSQKKHPSASKLRTDTEYPQYPIPDHRVRSAVKTLAEAGHIERVYDPSDTRSYGYAVTPSGRKLL